MPLRRDDRPEGRLAITRTFTGRGTRLVSVDHDPDPAASVGFAVNGKP
jgi:hypothetical protein